MHKNKKACTKAGQKLKHVHSLAAAGLAQATFLTPLARARHTHRTVLNTPHVAVSAPVSQSGFFTSIGFCRADLASTGAGQWPGSAQPYNSLRAKSASRLHAVLKYLAAPQQGVISTNHVGAIMAITLKTRYAGNLRTLRNRSLSLRLAAFRCLRRFTGPALAYRIALRAEVCHG